ncbi:hypothetical protein L1887_01337 [Cichorium endivia]|nr:hypothetical protein L1887_01337 [Cichorium endivia]
MGNYHRPFTSISKTSLIINPIQFSYLSLYFSTVANSTSINYPLKNHQLETDLPKKIPPPSLPCNPLLQNHKNTTFSPTKSHPYSVSPNQIQIENAFPPNHRIHQFIVKQ